MPVLRDGRIVGIVSRADLVRALAEASSEPSGKTKAAAGLLAEAVAGMERPFLHRQHEANRAQLAEQHRNPDEAGLIAADFRQGSRS